MSRLVTLAGGPPWGFRLLGGEEAGEPLKISKVNPSGPACTCGLVRGDYVTSINGISTKGILHSQAVNIIRKAKSKLQLEVRSGSTTLVSLTNMDTEHSVNSINNLAEDFCSQASTPTALVWSSTGNSTRVYKPVAFTPGLLTHTLNYQNSAMTSARGEQNSDRLLSLDQMSEIPATSAQVGSGKSKGANLFLARQKLIADMMAQEEEEERRAEEDKLRAEQEKIFAEQERIKLAEQQAKEDALRRKEKERLARLDAKLAASRAKAAAKAAPAVPETDLAWIKKQSKHPAGAPERKTLYQHIQADRAAAAQTNNNTAERSRSTEKDMQDDNTLRISESPTRVAATSSAPPVFPVDSEQTDGNTSSEDFLLNSPTILHLPKPQSPAIILLQKFRAGVLPKGAAYVTTDADDSKISNVKVSTESASTKNHDSTETKPNSEVDHASQKGRKWYCEMYKNMHKTDKNDYCDYTPTYKFANSVVMVEEQTIHYKETNTYQPTYKFEDFVPKSGSSSEDEEMLSDDEKTTQELQQRPLINGSHNTNTANTQEKKFATYKVPVKDIPSPVKVKSTSATQISSPKKVKETSSSSRVITVRDIPSPIRVDTDIKWDETESDSCLSPKLQYVQIQKGGEIPFTGLRKPAPITPPSRVVSPTLSNNYFDLDELEFIFPTFEPWPPFTPFQHDAEPKNSDLFVSSASWIPEKNVNASHTNAPPSVALNTQRPPSVASTVRDWPPTSNQPSSSATNNKMVSAFSREEKLTIIPGTVVPRVHSPSAQHEKPNILSLTKLTLKEVVKHIPAPVAGYDRSPAPPKREQRDEYDAKRRELMKRVEEEERRRKQKEELAQEQARRHSDYFTQQQKSPIPGNRYDNVPSSPRRTRFCVEGRKRARALYTFAPQHPKELSFEKGNMVDIIRQVDKNWFEGQCNGKVGILPVSYVKVVDEVLSSPPVRPSLPSVTTGCAKVLFNFTAQSPLEVSLTKGETVVLYRRVDANWYEGRTNSGRSGIFPASYISVITQPGESLTQCLSPRTNGTVDSVSAQSSPSNPHISPSNRPLSSGYGSGDQLHSNTSLQSNLNTNNNNNSSSTTLLKKSILNNRTESQRDNVSVGVVPDRDKSRVKPYQGLEMPSYRVLFNYSPQHNDELELREGDIVHVIEKCDDGWFVGTSGRTGMFGTFPGNYVTPV